MLSRQARREAHGSEPLNDIFQNKKKLADNLTKAKTILEFLYHGLVDAFIAIPRKEKQDKGKD